MDAMSVPILLALSAMSTMAMFASCAAALVSLLTLDSRLAAKLVVCSIYSLADRPTVRYACAALLKTVCWDCIRDAYSSLTASTDLPTDLAYSSMLRPPAPNSVSMPPMLCCNAPPRFRESEIILPMPAAAITFFRVPTSFVPSSVPALSPAEDASPPIMRLMLP